MIIDIICHERIGEIKFNLSEKDVINLLGPYESCFTRTSEADSKILCYDKIGVHIQISSTDEVEEVLVFWPNQTNLYGLDPLGKSIEEIKELSRIGPLKLIKCDVGLSDEKAGIVLVEVENRIDCIEVYK